MAKIHIDGKVHEVHGGENLLKACLSLNLDIPYFCWHPALGSIGACRQCAIKQFKDADDKTGRIVMSCMTPATDNMYISIADPEAQEFREAIVSFLMTNHPHDCPVCEEGGHCHLQDMTVMTRHHSRGYRFDKRTHQNQELGPFVGHEMNRCISCYRCVRYYKDYAGGEDLGVFASAANVYFGREKDGTLESEFSGNLTEICPTGVFTDKTHSSRYNRKWDMQYAPSVCSGCSVGCNTSPGERYGEIRRVENRYNSEVNGYFLCDRGRFGYGYTNRPDRPRHAGVRANGALARNGVEDAVSTAARLIGQAKKVVGIGSGRATLESNHALRELVGAENFYVSATRADWAVSRAVAEIYRLGPVAPALVSEIDEADAVLVLGEDPTMTMGRVALAIRQAVKGRGTEMTVEKRVPEWQAYSAADIAQHAKNPVHLVTPAATRLDDVAAGSHRRDLAGTIGFARAVLNGLDGSAGQALGGSDDEARQAVESVVAMLKGAKRPVVVSGFAQGSVELVQAAADIAWALNATTAGGTVRLCYSLSEANSMGLALMGAAGAVEDALAVADATLVVLEADLARNQPAATFEGRTVIAVDHQETPTVNAAAVLLPAASPFEGDGTWVNHATRAQRAFQVFSPQVHDRTLEVQESWRWIVAVMRATATATADAPAWRTLDDVTVAVAQAHPGLSGLIDAAPEAGYRLKGLKIARSPYRYSGRTAMHAQKLVHEYRNPQDADTALAFSMEGHHGTEAGDRPAALTPFAWAPGWNSPSAWNKFQEEVGGALRGGDAGRTLVRQGTGKPSYHRITPSPTRSTGDGLAALPLPRLFGSEELSARAAPIAARASETPVTVVVSAADAERLGLRGEQVRVSVGGASALMPLTVDRTFPAGAVGLPAGVPGTPAFAPGETVTLTAP